MWIRCIVLTLLTAVAATVSAACAKPPRAKTGPIETGADSLTAARKLLEGRWALESFEVYPAAGEPIRLSGAGTLEYDEFSNLKIEIRTDPATAERLRVAGMQTNGGVLSSDGRAALDVQQKTLTYIIQGQPTGAAASGPLGLNRKRHWQVEERRPDADDSRRCGQADIGGPLEENTMSDGTQRRSIIPVVLLLGVAVVQVTLVYTADLSPWKGGGFGMFSTTDDSGRRHVRIFVTAPDRSEEIAIAPSLEDAADRAAVLPTDHQLARLARRVVEREVRHERPVDVVRIEAWRITYAPLTLAATPQLIRRFEYRVDATAASRQ